MTSRPVKVKLLFLILFLIPSIPIYDIGSEDIPLKIFRIDIIRDFYCNNASATYFLENGGS